MARLVLAIAILMVLVAVVLAVMSVLKTAARSGHARLESSHFGGLAMQRIAFLVLLAVIFYASLWGGG